MHSRTSLSLAALSVACLSGAAFAPNSPRVLTDFDSGPGTAMDPLHTKFALSINNDDAGPGAAITDEQRVQQQAQAESAGGTQQANAADTTEISAKTTAVGDPPAGSDQQQ